MLSRGSVICLPMYSLYDFQPDCQCRDDEHFCSKHMLFHEHNKLLFTYLMAYKGLSFCGRWAPHLNSLTKPEFGFSGTLICNALRNVSQIFILSCDEVYCQEKLTLKGHCKWVKCARANISDKNLKLLVSFSCFMGFDM